MIFMVLFLISTIVVISKMVELKVAYDTLGRLPVMLWFLFRLILIAI